MRSASSRRAFVAVRAPPLGSRLFAQASNHRLCPARPHWRRWTDLRTQESSSPAPDDRHQGSTVEMMPVRRSTRAGATYSACTGNRPGLPGHALEPPTSRPTGYAGCALATARHRDRLLATASARYSRPPSCRSGAAHHSRPVSFGRVVRCVAAQRRSPNRNGLLSLMAPRLATFSERLCAPGEPAGDHRARGSCYPGNVEGTAQTLVPQVSTRSA
jgi:hypothetical protein